MDLGLLPSKPNSIPSSIVPHPDTWLQRPLISKDSKVLRLVQQVVHLQQQINQLLYSYQEKSVACENLRHITKYMQTTPVPREIIAFLDRDGELSSLIGRSTELVDIPVSSTVSAITSSIETLQPVLGDDLTSDKTVLKLQLTTQFTKLRLLMEAYTIPLCEALNKVEGPESIDQDAVVDVLDFQKLMHSLDAARKCLSIVSDRKIESASQELYEMFGSMGPLVDLEKCDRVSTLRSNAWEPRNIKAALVTTKLLVKEFHASVPGLQKKVIEAVDNQTNTSIVCTNIFNITTIINVVIADLLTITAVSPKEQD